MVSERSRRDGEPDKSVEKKPEQPSKVSVTKRSKKSITARLNGTREQKLAQTPQKVRIIGGNWKRTSLPVAKIEDLRPTPNRVRETLFNWIVHLVPDIATVHGLDMFAGTGALGFELASRGAHRVTLLESNQQLIDQLLQIKRKLHATHVDVIAGDALTTVSRWPGASFDVIFVDPPFESTLMQPALKAVTRVLADDGLIYVESGAAITSSKWAEHALKEVRASRAGRVHFYLLRHNRAPEDAGGRR